jgi:type I restriction enzyme S subunit
LLKTINLESYDVGSANPTLNRNHIHGLWLRIPPLPTQRRIASILSAYDDLIENNLRRIRLLEEAAQLIYKEWFVHLRFPGHENVKVVDGVPEGWERVKLNKVWNIKYGKNLPTKNIKNQGDFPVYGAAGKIGYYGKYNQEAKVALVTSRGNGSGQVHRTRGKAFVTNNSFVFLPQFKQVTFFYSVECLKIIDLTRYRTGSAQPQLTIAGMSNISLLLPSLKTLERYNNLVRPLIDQVDQLFEINELLTEARDLLLPRLMSGTIKLEEAEEKNTFPQ